MQSQPSKGVHQDHHWWVIKEPIQQTASYFISSNPPVPMTKIHYHTPWTTKTTNGIAARGGSKVTNFLVTYYTNCLWHFLWP